MCKCFIEYFLEIFLQLRFIFVNYKSVSADTLLQHFFLNNYKLIIKTINYHLI